MSGDYLFKKETDVQFVTQTEKPILGKEYEQKILAKLRADLAEYYASKEIKMPKKVPIVGVCVRGEITGRREVIVRVDDKFTRGELVDATGIPKEMMVRNPLFSEEPRCADMALIIPEEQIKHVLGIEPGGRRP